MTLSQSITIAAAQTNSYPGDVAANVRNHVRFIIAARALGVQFLVFLELSLCGYELTLLADRAMNPDDAQLDEIRTEARAANMSVVVGAPYALANRKPAIASFTYFPDGTYSVYCKHHLHSGEEQFAAQADVSCAVQHMLGETFAQAICADTGHASHAQSAATQGASLYLASMLVSVKGYATDSAMLQQYARDFSMGVLFSNHGAPTGGYVSAGKSAFWEPGGRLVAAAPGDGDGLLVLSKVDGRWNGNWHAI